MSITYSGWRRDVYGRMYRGRMKMEENGNDQDISDVVSGSMVAFGGALLWCIPSGDKHPVAGLLLTGYPAFISCPSFLLRICCGLRAGDSVCSKMA